MDRSVPRKEGIGPFELFLGLAKQSSEGRQRRDTLETHNGKSCQVGFSCSCGRLLQLQKPASETWAYCTDDGMGALNETFPIMGTRSLTHCDIPNLHPKKNPSGLKETRRPRCGSRG